MRASIRHNKNAFIGEFLYLSRSKYLEGISPFLDVSELRSVMIHKILEVLLLEVEAHGMRQNDQSYINMKISVPKKREDD